MKFRNKENHKLFGGNYSEKQGTIEEWNKQRAIAQVENERRNTSIEFYSKCNLL